LRSAPSSGLDFEQASGGGRLISLRTQYRKDFCAIVDLADRAKNKLRDHHNSSPVRGDEVALIWQPKISVLAVIVNAD
jgi:hypothetical protein